MVPEIRTKFFNMFGYLALTFFFGRSVYCDSPSLLDSKKTIATELLDVATDIIQRAKLNIPTDSEICTFSNYTHEPVDCFDVLRMGNNKSGMYKIWPMTRLSKHKSLNVYCDMNTDGGGWTVVQRRGNFGRPIDYFFKDWKSYKEGFGDIDKDFWLGNDNIFALTNQRQYSSRFDLQDVDMYKAHANYNSFWIDDEFNNHTLHISGYSGDAGDSMAYHNHQKFSTEDRKNDNHPKNNCAETYKTAWWFDSCLNADLNGQYMIQRNTSNFNGLYWKDWSRGANLVWTEIKIRPKKD